MKRRVLILAVTVAVSLALAWFVFVPSSPITERQYELIEIGMTVSEIETLLGQQATDRPDRSAYWRNEREDIIAVYCDANGRVWSKEFVPGRATMRWARWRKWLGF